MRAGKKTKKEKKQKKEKQRKKYYIQDIDYTIANQDA